MDMRKIVFPILLLIAGVFLAQCSHSGDRPATTAQEVKSTGTPVAQFPETSHDLGKIAAGQEYSYEFTVKNAGTGVLEIKKVLPG
jgi:hypothetical protein